MAFSVSRVFLLALAFMLLVLFVQAFPSARQDGEEDENEAEATSTPGSSPTVSTSPSASASFGASPEEDEEVCVDAKYLTKFPSHHLVHNSHLMSEVLCPKFQFATLPCATGDHMLRVAGESMSYRAFCETRACDTKRMLVNSVLSHVWEEETHNGNVVLTMLDSRHPESFQKAIHRITSLKRSVVRSIL